MRNFINIDTSDYINAINLHLGIYYPLDGFVTHEEFKSILLKKRLKNAKNFISILLIISLQFHAGQNLQLFHFAIMVFLIVP